jgi:hypothetical protein
MFQVLTRLARYCSRDSERSYYGSHVSRHMETFFAYCTSKMYLYYCVFLFFSLSLGVPNARSGSLSDFKETEMFTSSTPYANWYFSWDNSTFYFAVNKSAPTIATDAFFVYIDSDPRPAPLSGLGSATDGTKNLPFNADFYISILYTGAKLVTQNMSNIFFATKYNS